MILWKITTAISIKHRILATFNIKKINLSHCMSLIVKKWSLHISYNMKNISLSFCSILYDIFNLFICKKRNEKWVLILWNFLIKNARNISTFLNYRTSEINWRLYFFFGRGGVDLWHWALSFIELFFTKPST